MKLEWQGKTIEIATVSKITPKIRVEFVEIMRELKTDEVDEQKRKILESFVPTSDPEKVQIVNLKPLFEFALLQKKFASPETIYHNDLVFIRAFKKIIDFSKVPEDWKELIQLDEESEFWQSQDIVEITKEIESFRAKIGI